MKAEFSAWERLVVRAACGLIVLCAVAVGVLMSPLLAIGYVAYFVAKKCGAIDLSEMDGKL